MHKQAIKLVLFEKQFDKFLAVFFAAERRFYVKHRVFRRINKQFFAQSKPS